jgi:hypothetical protein
LQDPIRFFTIRTRFFDDALLAAARNPIDQVVFRRQDGCARLPLTTRRNAQFLRSTATTCSPTGAVLARVNAEAVCDRRVVRQDLAHPWKSSLINAY